MPMANGADSNEFVVVSKVRTGLKRELAFALKVQAEMCESLGRTRARKAQNEGVDSPNGKRLKISESSETQKIEVERDLKPGDDGENEKESAMDVSKNLGESMSEEEAKSDVVDVVSDDEPKSKACHSVVNNCKEELKSGGVLDIANEDETKSGGVVNLVKDSLVEALVEEELKVEEAKSIELEKPSMDKTTTLNNSKTEEVKADKIKDGFVEAVTEIEEAKGNEAERPSLDEPMPLITPQKVDVNCERPSMDESMPLITPQKEDANCESPSMDETMALIIPKKEDANCERSSMDETMALIAPKKEDANCDRSSMDETKDLITPKKEDANSSEPGKPSTDEMTSIPSGNSYKFEEPMIEKPVRRFTRSVLKPKQETLEKYVVEDQEEGIDSNVGSSFVSRQTMLDTRTPNKRIKKFPGKLKELLDTGILDGEPVKYIRGSKARAPGESGLRGVIKGPGIVCNCGSCKGVEVVTPTVFELHAGSSNKRPPEYIYLENGQTLRDFMNICLNSTLGTLEEAVRSIIGCRKSTICFNCKGPIQRDDIENAVLLCNSCKELKETQPKIVETAKKNDESPKSTLVPKCSDSVSKQDSSQGKSRGPKCSDSVSKQDPSQGKSRGRLTRKDVRLHKLVFEEDVLPDGTEVAYYSRGQKLLVGYKMGCGIICSCCNSEVSPSQFEAHAGCAARRKPLVILNYFVLKLSFSMDLFFSYCNWQQAKDLLALILEQRSYEFPILWRNTLWNRYLHIYTSNGVSLHELSLSLSRDRKFSTIENDDLCTACHKGGDLVCCDGCPRAFHQDCIHLQSVPTGTWYCKYCQNLFNQEKSVERNPNAVAAGRIPGIDPIEQITNRCIRIVSSDEIDFGGCAICKSHDFSKSDFGSLTVLYCDQCEREFHVGCLKDHGMQDLKELPQGVWFCCLDCHRINSALQKLVVRGEQELPDALLNAIQKNKEESETGVKLDVKWRVLNGKMASDDETKLLLSKAKTIFHDCFAPIIDSATNCDFITAMLYGDSIKGQDFSRMYCALLMVNESVVSAGLFRIYGSEVAELPLVATNAQFQKQGYFQTLFSCLERLLAFLNVKSLVLPAADEAESIWTNKFGFNKLAQDELNKYRKHYQIMIFNGTSVLSRPVPKCRIVGA